MTGKIYLLALLIILISTVVILKARKQKLLVYSFFNISVVVSTLFYIFNTKERIDVFGPYWSFFFALPILFVGNYLLTGLYLYQSKSKNKKVIGLILLGLFAFYLGVEGFGQLRRHLQQKERTKAYKQATHLLENTTVQEAIDRCLNLTPQRVIQRCSVHNAMNIMKRQKTPSLCLSTLNRFKETYPHWHKSLGHKFLAPLQKCLQRNSLHSLPLHEKRTLCQSVKWDIQIFRSCLSPKKG